MKTNLLLFLFFFISLGLTAQVPQGFNYQAIARDNSGNPITGATISVKLSILSDTTNFYAAGTGTYVWEEQHDNVKTNSFGLFTIVLGNPTATKKQGSAASFSAISWTPGPLYIGAKIYFNSAWKIMGSAKLWTVPYAMVSASAAKADGITSGSKVSVVSSDDATSLALFEVKRKDGQTVFAVYPDAVNIYVPPAAKSGKGGFAIGGFGTAKAPSQDYFRVTPDSVRIYIDNSPATKSGKGGFAIGGFDNAKGGLLKNYFMNVSGTNTVDTVKGSPQILWFPNKNAFLAGNVHIGAVDSVGLYSTALGYRSIAMGNYSQAFGYKAKAFGDYSTSIGKYSIAGARSGGISTASNAFAFGSGAQATGNNTYALGYGAVASGSSSFAFGSSSSASGTSSMALGTSSTASGNYSNAFGRTAIAIGQYSLALGTNTTANGNYSSAIGYGSTTATAATNSIAIGTSNQAIGTNSTAIGYQSQSKGDKSIAIGSFYSYSYSLPRLTLGKGEPTGEGKGFDDLLPIRPIIPISTIALNFSRANIAEGQYSVAVGNGNLAQNGGFVFGSNSDAIQFGAVALGTNAKANNTNSLAAGYNAVAGGVYSVAIGNNVSANSYGEIALGQFSDVYSGSATEWNENNLLLSVGNGIDDANRSNALTIFKNGKTAIRGRYAVSTFNNKTSRLTRIYIPGVGWQYITRDYVYGVYANLSRDDAAIEYYYSGYFTSSGTEGTYRGLYADLFTTPQANITTLYSSGAYNTAVGANPRVLYVDETGYIGYYSSSIRYKKDIEELSDINWLYDLRPVTYRYKTSDSAEKEIGLIAEEVLKVNPNFVSFNDKGEPETVTYSELVTPLLKAVQDQNKTIQSLRSENEMLRERMEKLESIVSNLVKEEK